MPTVVVAVLDIIVSGGCGLVPETKSPEDFRVFDPISTLSASFPQKMYENYFRKRPSFFTVHRRRLTTSCPRVYLFFFIGVFSRARTFASICFAQLRRKIDDGETEKNPARLPSSSVSPISVFLYGTIK